MLKIWVWGKNSVCFFNRNLLIFFNLIIPHLFPRDNLLSFFSETKIHHLLKKDHNKKLFFIYRLNQNFGDLKRIYKTVVLKICQWVSCYHQISVIVKDKSIAIKTYIREQFKVSYLFRGKNLSLASFIFCRFFIKICTFFNQIELNELIYPTTLFYYFGKYVFFVTIFTFLVCLRFKLKFFLIPAKNISSHNNTSQLHK